MEANDTSWINLFDVNGDTSLAYPKMVLSYYDSSKPIENEKVDENGNDIMVRTTVTSPLICLLYTSIAECVSFCDRVIVLSKRPAKVKNIYEINLLGDTPSKRRKANNFYDYYDKIWGDLDKDIS